MPLLTSSQIGHFHAFGYVLLPGMLSPAEMAELGGAYTAALSDPRSTAGRAIGIALDVYNKSFSHHAV